MSPFDIQYLGWIELILCLICRIGGLSGILKFLCIYIFTVFVHYGITKLQTIVPIRDSENTHLQNDSNSIFVSFLSWCTWCSFCCFLLFSFLSCEDFICCFCASSGHICKHYICVTVFGILRVSHMFTCKHITAGDD